MAGFVFDARAALSEIQGRTPATTATTATKPALEPEMSQLSQLSQPLPGENATLATPDPDAFEERAAISHEAHTIALADDGASLPEPIFTLTRAQAETLAAQEQGYDDADSLHSESVWRWAAEIERLA